MRPYGMNPNKSLKIHGHNDCGICSSYPPTKGEARATFKNNLRNEFMDLIEQMDDNIHKDESTD